MNKDIAEKLVTALRSGEYEQCQQALRNDTGYCCLGVLTDIAVKEGVAEPWQKWNIGGRRQYTVDGINSVLPPEVRRWAGMKTNNGGYDHNGFEYNKALSADNDQGKSFSEIADIIEAHVYEL